MYGFTHFTDEEAQALGFPSVEAFEDAHCGELPDEWFERRARALGFESFAALSEDVDAAQLAEWEATARAQGFASLDEYIAAQSQA